MFWLIDTAVLQYLFVFRLGLDVYGIAWATVGNSGALTVFVAMLVRRCGITLDWQVVLGNVALAALVAIAALAVSKGLAWRSEGLVALIVGGGILLGRCCAGLFRDAGPAAPHHRVAACHVSPRCSLNFRGRGDAGRDSDAKARKFSRARARLCASRCGSGTLPSAARRCAQDRRL